MNFGLREHTILLVRAGSRAYGMHTSTSDLDLKGVAIPPANFSLGLDVFEQADKPEHFPQFLDLVSEEERRIAVTEKVEGSIYELRKFMKLAKDCNPNILEVLFCREEDVLMSDLVGSVLRDHRDDFLSTKVKFTLTGYAVAQLKRIKTHRAYLQKPPTARPQRKDFGLPETTLIPADQLAAANAIIKKQMDSWEVDLSCVDDDSERIRIMGLINETMTEVLAGTTLALEDERQRRWHAAVVATGLPENLIHQLERERRYQHAMSEHKSYENWLKTRNEARAALEAKHGYDTKHGAHLVRLMRMAEEIMTTGKVNVWRGGLDADELIAIRHGAWSFEKLSQFADDMDAKLNQLYIENPAKLKKAADQNLLSTLSVKLHRRHFPFGL